MKRPDEDRALLCELTEEELRVKADQLAAAVADKQEVEAAKRLAMAQAKKQLEAIDARIIAHKNEVQSKREQRQVRCSWRMMERVNRKTGETRRVLELQRTDTWDVVETREVTTEDLQGELDLAGSN